MDFEVLGPRQVRQGEQPVQLSAPMPRMVLGVLLTRANTPVPVDVLVDALWAGQRDPRAAKKLQLHVHRLRRVLDDPARIRFEHGGYTLQVHPGELDAERFESALAEGTDAGQPARAVALLRRALQLWRGDPFSDITDLPLLRAEADRLTERRLTGLTQLYAAELACGHANAIIPELVELAARHPMREQLQGLLMTALYQAGRQAEALEVYHRTRGALVEQLGLEPGNELQRLEHAILTGDPMLEAPTTPSITPAQLPADITDFTGRKAQLAAVQHLAAAADRSATVLVAITGRAGVGKTTLAVHAAHRLRVHYPDGQLYVNLHGAQAHPLAPADVLARFLRSLGVDRMTIPDDAEERAALYRSRLADRRLLILLDNAECEAQLRPLLPGTPGCTVLVTSRTRLAGLNGARLVDLDIFEPDQAVELLARVAGPQRVAAEPAATREIVRLCGFLPLAVRVAGARLGARPHWPLSRLEADLADERHRLEALRLGDLEVRASFALSYESLDVIAQRTFRLLGLLAIRDFTPWVVAALLDVPQATAEELVDTLVDMHLLDVAGHDASGRLRYRFHDLLRVYARELLAAQEPEADRLAALDRAFGGWLALTEEAGRAMASSAFAGTLERGTCWRPDESVVRSVVTDPSGWFTAERAALMGAVGQAYSVGSDQLGWALGVRLARTFLIRGYYDDWREVCELMLAGARRAVNGGREGMALRGQGELRRLQHRLDEALEGFEQTLTACETAGDHAGRTLTTGRIGTGNNYSGNNYSGDKSGRFDEALPRLEDSLTYLSKLADRHSDASAMRRLGTVHRPQRCYEKATRCFQQVLDVLDAFSDPLRGVALMSSGPARGIRLAALQGTPYAGW
ncbi:MAG TPA: BTAD domain-containing putative transcriptional regulator [Pseudonocardiaceae bacterium]|nr:BTAD domain-containing putative transcriptional regulator [Pseudonocardiaceae bacterium]